MEIVRGSALRLGSGQVRAAALRRGSALRQGSGQVQGQWLMPDAQARWLGAGVAYYTPQMVETVLRNAMAGDLVSQWEMFDLMETTWPRLSKNLNQLKDAVVAQEFEVQPWAPRGEEPSEEAVARAKVVEEALWGMHPRVERDENDFEDSIRDLLDARGKGVSVLEVDWEAKQSARGGGLMGPRCTRWVHPSNYGYPTSGSGLMLRVGGQWREWPNHKFVIGVCKNKTGHPLGSAMLHVLAWWWAAINFTSEWFLNLAQVFGQPVRWATYDPNMTATDQAKLRLMMQNMGSAAWGMFPEGTTLEMKEALKSATDNPQKVLLDTADLVCDLMVLRQTLASDVKDGAGSRALGEVHERTLGGVELACAKWGCKALQPLVRSIVMLNFGDDRECPFLRPPGEAEETPAALGEVLAKVALAGLEPADEAIPELSERLGFEVQRKSGAPFEPFDRLRAGTDGQGRTGTEEEAGSVEQGAGIGEVAEVKARAAGGKRKADPVDGVAARRAKVLGEAYRGVMAPFREIVLASASPEEALQKLTAAYADWKPERLVAELESALQLCAAASDED